MTDNLEHFSIKGLASSSRRCLSLVDRRRSDLTSPHEPLAMYKNFTNCLSVPNSYPSATLVEMETTARSIWFLIEKILEFSNRPKTSPATSMPFCQTYKSSNFSIGRLSCSQITCQLIYQMAVSPTSTPFPDFTHFPDFPQFTF